MSSPKVAPQLSVAQFERLTSEGSTTASTKIGCCYRTQSMVWYNTGKLVGGSKYPQTLLTTTVSDIPSHARPFSRAYLQSESDIQRRTIIRHECPHDMVQQMVFEELKRDIPWHTNARHDWNPGSGNTYRGHTSKCCQYAGIPG